MLLTAAILEQHEQYALATEAYARVPADNPSHLAAELGRAEALESEGKPDAALEALKALSKANPGEPLVWSTMADVLRQFPNDPDVVALYADATQAVHNADASAPAAAAQAPREGPADLSDGLGFKH